MFILYDLCHVDPVVDVIAKEGVPPQIWRTGAFPPKLAAALRPDKHSNSNSDDNTKLGSDGSAPFAARHLERAKASYEKRKEQPAPAAFCLGLHCDPLPPRQTGLVDFLNWDYRGNDASGPFNAGPSLFAGNIPSGLVMVPRVQQAETVHNPTFYRALTTKQRKKQKEEYMPATLHFAHCDPTKLCQIGPVNPLNQDVRGSNTFVPSNTGLSMCVNKSPSGSLPLLRASDAKANNVSSLSTRLKQHKQ